MLKSLAEFLKTGRISASSSDYDYSRHDEHELRLAVAVLLVEAATLEENYSEREQNVIGDLLTTRFDISDDERTALLELAQKTQSDAVELHRFTNTIKEKYSPEERVDIVEMLWEVAYADGVLHDYEAHLLRKVAGLIHVSDRDRGDARKRVLAKLGLE